MNDPFEGDGKSGNLSIGDQVAAGGACRNKKPAGILQVGRMGFDKGSIAAVCPERYVVHCFRDGHGIPINLSAGSDSEKGEENRIGETDKLLSGKGFLEPLFCRFMIKAAAVVCVKKELVSGIIMWPRLLLFRSLQNCFGLQIIGKLV